MKFEFIYFTGTYKNKECVGVGGPTIDNLQQIFVLGYFHTLLKEKVICDPYDMCGSTLHIISSNPDSIEIDIGDTVTLGNYMTWLKYLKSTTATILNIDESYIKFVNDEGKIKEIRICEFIARVRLANG